MTKQTKIFILIALAIIILIIVFALIRLGDGRNTDTTPSTDTTQTIEPLLPGIQTPAVIEPAPEGPQEQNPVIIATDFAERYGSFSNQGEYQNIRDLFPQMTHTMRARSEALIASNPLETGAYVGTTTKAVRVETISKTDVRAEILVYTQRIDSTSENPRAITRYQSANITLIRDDLKWLVDTFTWQ